ncbi:MAG TPA: flagellar biosynthesis protein FlhA [Pseudomonas sp.]|nr:flagellar biosynthesis protein FlhA [Pseudomonas sp.]
MDRSQLINSARSNLGSLGRGNIGVPVLLLIMLAMMMLPIPPFLLDVFFTFNIALSIVVLLVCVYALRPLDFAAFPTILLVATLLRLALNVASTRVVLLHGHDGHAAAGKVIQAFGDVVIGGNYVVGIVVFAILMIINFVVVTKGAGRISEVSARFTLDAMPGKQMAIDADLNAGLINQDQAKARRAEVAQEAEFYGSMDGASKFVRGDAIAGLLILFINLIGGMAIGMVQHGMTFGDAGRVYALLTIGDGLVAQLPSLLLSTAAAIMVTRASGSEDMGKQINRQMFDSPKALAISAAIMIVMGLVPGMPHIAFLSLGLMAAGGAYLVWKKQNQSKVKAAQEVQRQQDLLPSPQRAAETKELGWDDVTPIDMIGLEVGYRLIPLVDRNQGGQLLARIKGVRKKLSQDLGFLMPTVHIRDNLDLAPSTYRLTLMGVILAEAEIYPEREMAINPGQVFGTLSGISARDPAFGLEAVWIDVSQRGQAQSLGYTVVDASTVAATHLNHLLHQHAKDMLGRSEMQKLLDKLGGDGKGLVDEVVPKLLTLTQLQRILQNLLEENVPIRDLRTILDTLAEHGGAQQPADIAELTAVVRVALGRSIINQYFGSKPELRVIGLDFNLEQVVMQAVGNGGSLEPSLAETLMEETRKALKRQELGSDPAVLVVPNRLRLVLSRFLRRRLRQLAVIALSEIPDDRTLRITSIIGTPSTSG